MKFCAISSVQEPIFLGANPSLIFTEVMILAGEFLAETIFRK
jgi:hypothetical protein